MSSNVKVDPFLLRFGAVFFTLMGLVFLPVGLARAFAEAQTMNWPTVEGTILRSELRTSGSGKRKSTHWDYSYRFTVNGRHYEGASRTRGCGYSGPALVWNESGHEDYPRGTTVTVRYNESDPKNSYFGPGPDWTNYVLPVGGGLVFAGLGLLSWRRANTLSRRTQTLS